MPDVPIDRSGVVSFPDKGPATADRATPTGTRRDYADNAFVGGIATPGCVIRGINCPQFGNGSIRFKVDAAIQYLDANGLQQFTARVAIDRSALIMLREELQASDRDRAEIEHWKNSVRTADDMIAALKVEILGLRSGQTMSGPTVPDARNPPDVARSPIREILNLVPPGADFSVSSTSDKVVITIPR